MSFFYHCSLWRSKASGRPGMVSKHHCNTGRLATAASVGTALGVIQVAHERHGIDVIVSETRPLLQGGRLTSWELAQASIPFTLITDSMSADLMRRGEITAVRNETPQFPSCKQPTFTVVFISYYDAGSF